MWPQPLLASQADFCNRRIQWAAFYPDFPFRLK